MREAVLFEDETLRDGLQVEKIVLRLEDKLALFDRLVAAGIKRIQVGSFVHPGIVPQMADTDELIRRIEAPPDVLLTGLVLNRRGVERALDCGLGHLSMSVSVSDTHSRKNANMPAAEALDSMCRLIEEAVAGGVTPRGGVQCAFGCVYEGAVPEQTVVDALKSMAAAGARELNLADTTGMGNPVQVRRLITKVREALPDAELSLHLHDTRGLGLANMMAGYQAGVRQFDTATGGLGGCPFVRGAAGNVPTEDAAHLFAAIEADTGIDLPNLCRTVDLLETLLEHPLPGRMCRVLKAMGGCQ